MLQAKLARAEQQQPQPQQPQPQHTTNDSASDDAEAGTIAYMRAELDAARAAATKSDARAREAIAGRCHGKGEATGALSRARASVAPAVPCTW